MYWSKHWSAWAWLSMGRSTVRPSASSLARTSGLASASPMALRSAATRSAGVPCLTK